SLLAALTACSAGDGDAPPATTTAGTALASSSIPAGSVAGGSSSRGVPVGPSDPQPARGSVEVVRTLAHDPSLFTQGLQVVGDEIYESTGRVGASLVQRRPL